MPFTTLVYAVAMHNGGLTNFSEVMMIVAILVDLGVLGGAERERRGRRITDCFHSAPPAKFRPIAGIFNRYDCCMVFRARFVCP